MALRQLVLRKRIEALKSQLDGLRGKDADFETRRAALKTREAEIEAAVNEVTEDTPAEDKKTVDDSVAAYDADEKALTDEAEANDGAKKNVEDEIRQLEAELKELDERSKPRPAAPEEKPGPAERKDDHFVNRKGFMGQTMEQRTAYLARDDVKEFYTRVRGMIGQKRAVTGAELNIPIVTLALLRDNLDRYSKLISLVRLQPVSGKARQTIMGTIPEAIWTEAVGKLNELTISFAQIEVDGYKLGGFIPIPNSTLEDSDIDLANTIEDALGQAIGYAIDKAILYGKGVKMLLGVVTRLAQSSKPASWPDSAPTWTDLHTTNILKIDPSGMTAEQFFAALIVYLGVARGNYATGGTFWAMSRKTKSLLMSKAINFNAAGALVAGANGVMPVEGGKIVELDFIPYGDIIGGYGSLYELAERAGASIAVSDEVMFIEDMTVFKGTSRYDGMPVFGEAFVIVNINNTTPTTTASFPGDTANPSDAYLASLTIGSLPLSPSFDGAVESYTAATTNATDIVTATAAKSGATVTILLNDAAFTNGSAATWNTGSNTVSVTVTYGTTTKTYTATVTKS